eukprot:381424-Pleurochrysis_carterae.AAC.1
MRTETTAVVEEAAMTATLANAQAASGDATLTNAGFTNADDAISTGADGTSTEANATLTEAEAVVEAEVEAVAGAMAEAEGETVLAAEMDAEGRNVLETDIEAVVAVEAMPRPEELQKEPAAEREMQRMEVDVTALQQLAEAPPSNVRVLVAATVGASGQAPSRVLFAEAGQARTDGVVDQSAFFELPLPQPKRARVGSGEELVACDAAVGSAGLVATEAIVPSGDGVTRMPSKESSPSLKTAEAAD